jgi:FkbM family methyltransferase
MKLLSRIILKAAKYSPYGHWKLVSIAANNDPTLWDFQIPLKFDPSRKLRADLREPVYTQFLRHGCIPHQTATDKLLEKIIKKGDLIFDIGANIGYLSILFSHLTGSTGKVIAIEPSPRSFNLLERNISIGLNSSNCNIKAINIGISEEQGELILNETNCLERSSLEAANEKTNQILVAVKNLDTLCREHGNPSFVKIDVEGHEHYVFKGAEILLSKADARPLIMFEALEPSQLNQCIRTINKLSKNQFNIYRITSNAKLAAWDQPQGLNDYLAVPFERLTEINEQLIDR